MAGRLAITLHSTAAAIVLGGIVWGVAQLAPPEGAPNGADMLRALGRVLEQEAAQDGGALGARLSFESPARLTAELVDAVVVREILSVEPVSCRTVAEKQFECVYIARGERRCVGDGCAALGGAGAQPSETRSSARFTYQDGRWRAGPAQRK